MKRNTRILKLTTVIAAAAMVFSFAGCGDAKNGEAETPAEDGAEASSEGEMAYLDEIDAKDYVKLGEYKGLEITQAAPEVSEEYRDAYINYVLSLNPPRGVETGDTVNIDYAGTEDGIAFEGGTASGQNLTIGSGQFIDGFEDGLIGAEVGDTVELNLTFPENYDPSMAGKSVVFTVTVNSIMSGTPQELTDEYVLGLNIGCSTVDEYRQYVQNMLTEEETRAYEENVKNAVVAAAMEKCEFIKELPQTMIDRYADTLTANLTSEAERYGSTFDVYMQQYYGMDEATYTDEIKNQALNSARQYVMLKAIADEEDLNVTEEELQTEMETLAAGSGFESVEDFKKSVDDKGYKEYMMGQKVMDMLSSNAKISAE